MQVGLENKVMTDRLLAMTAIFRSLWNVELSGDAIRKYRQQR
jgi:hypothetical protein